MRVAITGATGTLGRAIVQECLDRGDDCLAIARGEDRMALLREEHGDDCVRYVLGDVRDRRRMADAFDDCDAVIHCAALKRVEMYEHDPRVCVEVNVAGTQAVLDAAAECGIDKVLTISTDKAVLPVSLYGFTKAVAERLTLAAGGAVARYGNIFGSTGSVTERWAREVAAGRPLTITDPTMGRFLVKPVAAAKFALQCLDTMEGGEEFVDYDTPVAIVGDLARALYPAWEWDVVGSRPGERGHEWLSPKRCSVDVVPMTVEQIREWVAS